MRYNEIGIVARALRVAGVCALLFAPFAPLSAQGDTEVMSNAKVIQMVVGKLPKNLIESKVAAAQPGYDLSVEGIVALNAAKVDQTTIKAMINVANEGMRRKTAPEALVGMDEVLNNDKIVRMVTSKVPKGVITMKMEMSRSAYDVSATGLVNLNASKVPQDLIKMMMLPPPPPPAPAADAPAIPVREAKKPAGEPPPAATDKGAKAPATKTPATKTPATKTPPAKTPPATTPPVKKGGL